MARGNAKADPVLHRVQNGKKRRRKKLPVQKVHADRMIKEAHREARKFKEQAIKELVLEYGRLDVFAHRVLGYDRPQWFHREMIDFQDNNLECQILGFRGSRKTTYLTIARVILEIIKNPDIRILISADTVDQSKSFLRAIKSHFTSNEKLISLFGNYYAGAGKWGDTEIIVNRRTRHYAEATVMCVGIGTTLPSRHFDMIICDDLVTEDNSMTEGLREKTKNYFYKSLLPCLESPNGKLCIIGTRWHEEDLYGHFEKFDYADCTLRIPAIDEETDQSIWEEKFPTERLHRIRTGNLAAFELQWMCRSGLSVGDIFIPQHFKFYETLPPDVFLWQAVDLAASEKDRADFFVHVTGAIQRSTKAPFLISAVKAKLTFPKQVDFIARQWFKFRDEGVLAVAIESNAYQIALKQQMRVSHPEVTCHPVYTQKDKITRANQMAWQFTENPLHVRPRHADFVRMLQGFPTTKGSKDCMDALDIFLTIGMRGRRRRREKEVGVL